MDKKDYGFKEGKDYFGFEGQAERYQKYRPQYPKEFVDFMLSKETLPNLAKRELAIDIGTGTGLLAKHFAGLFDRVVGTDLSEAQLKQASESHKEVQNLKFMQLDVKQLPEFLKHEDLSKVDLFTIGQALHWFDDIDGTLRTVNSVLRDDSYFEVYAYSIPRIFDGGAWFDTLSKDMSAQGFEIQQGNFAAGSYTFAREAAIHSDLSKAYNETWALIYPHFKFNRSVIESFYTPFKFAESTTVPRKVIWLDVTVKRPDAVIGYLESVSAYRCYLEDKHIVKGSAEDPVEVLKAKFAQYGNPEVDFVTPYFCYALGKK